METNPLLVTWNTRWQTPPFGLIKLEHYEPAVREAMKNAEERVEAIANQSYRPTFDNTVVALEQSSEQLDRVTALLFNLNECCTSDAMQQMVIDLMPELTRHDNSIWMNEKLFARVREVYDNRDALALDEEQKELLDRYYQRFVRNGVNLDDEGRVRFAAITEELATLSEQFNQNVMADTNSFELHLTEESLLSGLPEGVVETAREDAISRGKEGWLFTLHAPSYRPFLTYSDNRELRERMWRAYNSRGNHGDGADNNAIIRRICELRLEMARLLGYETFADYKLERTMAGDVDTVERFLDSLREACLPHAKRDLEEVADYAHRHGADYDLQSWDFPYWSERLKKERYSIDSELLRPYFQLERVCEGIFGLYERLYGLVFRRNEEIEKYHEEVQVYEIYDGSRFMGVLYLDLFPRASKRGGAWMTEFRQQSCVGGDEVRPLIQVVCNFTKPSADRPSLLTFDEVETFMHEMGHAMHGMLSDVRYPSTAGTSVRRDFVEMPSQVMENWCYETEFLNTFAYHYQTGEAIPQEYVERIRQSKNYNAGWLCLRQLNFGVTDMGYHTLRSPMPEDGDASKFERAQMTELLPEVDGTCTSTAFTHIFSGGYAAGYYGYKWAEVLDADVYSRFKEEGIFNRDTAAAFRREILSRGGSEHPSVLFRNFMGRDPDNMALIRRCGF